MYEILIVEDEVNIAETVKEYLERDVMRSGMSRLLPMPLVL